VVFRDRVAILIRDGKVFEILPLSAYSYGG
jgi:hypothetical protein